MHIIIIFKKSCHSFQLQAYLEILELMVTMPQYSVTHTLYFQLNQLLALNHR